MQFTIAVCTANNLVEAFAVASRELKTELARTGAAVNRQLKLLLQEFFRRIVWQREFMIARVGNRERIRRCHRGGESESWIQRVESGSWHASFARRKSKKGPTLLLGRVLDPIPKPLRQERRRRDAT